MARVECSIAGDGGCPVTRGPIRNLLLGLLLAGAVFPFAACGGKNMEAAATPEAAQPQEPQVPDPGDFAEGPGRASVVIHCTGCHSGRLVQQNRATREGWADLIDWMRRKQGFWKLEPAVEAEILDYLAAYYGRSRVAENPRRPPLPVALQPPTRAAYRARERVEADGRDDSGGSRSDAIQTN